MWLWIRTTALNVTEGHSLGGDPPFETSFETTNELFKRCVKWYGRCVGKMFVGDNRQIGWVFNKREKYSDCDQTYLHETWVEVHDKPPTTTTEFHYHDFKGTKSLCTNHQ